jgi:lysine 2,3-aminomutase
VARGIEIIESLRGHTSGYAIPQFVIDAPGGGGKVPVNPNYVVYHDSEKVVLRNFEGRIFEYPELQVRSVPNHHESELMTA